LVVNVAGLGLSGWAAAEWLEQQHSIVPELATAHVSGVFRDDCQQLSGLCMHMGLDSHIPGAALL
jgi:hypothetical protein